MKKSLVAVTLLLAIAVFIPGAGLLAQREAVGAPARSAPNCQNIQLDIQFQASNGGAGHIAVIYHIQNLMGRACSLTGYPGVELLDTQFHSLPTRVHRGAGGLIGSPPQRTVTLAPHGRAFFALSYSDVPTTGNGPCPTARYLMITAPNDYLPVVTYAFGRGSITACNGNLYVTPVTASPTFG